MRASTLLILLRAFCILQAFDGFSLVDGIEEDPLSYTTQGTSEHAIAVPGLSQSSQVRHPEADEVREYCLMAMRCEEVVSCLF